MTATNGNGTEMTSPCILERQVSDMREDMKDIKAGMAKLVDAIAHFSVLEDRYQGAMITIERMRDKQDKQDTKIRELEMEQVKFLSMGKGASWAAKTLWMVGGGGVTYVVGTLISQALKHVA